MIQIIYVFLIVCLLPFTSSAAEMIYKDSLPIALTGLSEKWVSGDGSGCENHSGIFEVEEIAYNGISEIVGGIRVKPLHAKDGKAPFLIRLNTEKLSNVEQSWIPTLVNKGNKLFIEYDVCGSGGFSSAQNIYKTNSNDYFIGYLLIVLLILVFLYVVKKYDILYIIKKYNKREKENSRSKSEPQSREAQMTRYKALEILGLKDGASKKDIVEARKRLLKGLHPDAGGSNPLAALINQAADFLLK